MQAPLLIILTFIPPRIFYGIISTNNMILTSDRNTTGLYQSVEHQGS